MTDELMDKISSLDDNSKSKFRNIMSSLMSNALDETLLDSIDNFTDKEYEVFIKMLAEATEGQSSTFEEYSLVDYEEIPVSIEEFIINPEYIGRSTDNGKALYPYWKDLAVDIFKPGSKVQELALTGAIGTGKSTIALICLSYVLYKLLCLREPAKYYQLLEGSKIAIALFNISVNQVYGIGYDKLQSLLKKSPWFLRHGTLVGRSASRVMAMIASGEQVPDELLSDLTYHPGKDIHIVAGSQESNFTGYDVFCMTGDTEILTDTGYRKLEDIDSKVRVYSQDDSGNIVLSDLVDIVKTKDATELVELVLGDDSLLRCTSDHLLRLSDGSYKKAIDITEDDDLMEVSL